jgi:hypothetical protein
VLSLLAQTPFTFEVKVSLHAALNNGYPSTALAYDLDLDRWSILLLLVFSVSDSLSIPHGTEGNRVVTFHPSHLNIVSFPSHPSQGLEGGNPSILGLSNLPNLPISLKSGFRSTVAYF